MLIAGKQAGWLVSLPIYQRWLAGGMVHYSESPRLCALQIPFEF